jgi:hypothetical protein
MGADMNDTKMVTVYRSQGMLGAEVIRGKLELAGIPVYLKYEAVGQVFGLTVDGLGLVEVMVPEEWVEQAVDLIAEDEVSDDSEP